MTNDHDRKSLIRKRMAKTGESYVTARRHLQGEQATDEAKVPSDRGSVAAQFRLSQAVQSGAAHTQVIEAARTHMVESVADHGRVHVFPDAVRVATNTPPVFSIDIPRSAVLSCERLPDRRRWSGLGIRGGRGKYWVATSPAGLVRLRLARPVEAQVNSRSAAEWALPGVKQSSGRFALRDRVVPVRQLSISLEDPDAFLAAMHAPASD